MRKGNDKKKQRKAEKERACNLCERDFLNKRNEIKNICFVKKRQTMINERIILKFNNTIQQDKFHKNVFTDTHTHMLLK